MRKLGCLIVVCALAGVLVALGKASLSAYNNYTNLTKKALEQNVKTETFHIYNVTETKEGEEKNLDTTEGIRIVVRKSDDLFWTYKAGDEISVTYGRADDEEDSLYNYKITSLLSSGNEYKGVEQTKTLNWKKFQEKIEE